MVFGFSQYRNLPERVPTDWSPALLLTGGPYAFSRNPMYVGEVALWLGLAVLYGSPAVLAGFAAMFALMRRLAARVEAGLEAAFAHPSRPYKTLAPRGLGRPRAR